MPEAVRLKLARQEYFGGGGFSGAYAPIAVKVKNLGFGKDVSVLYTTDGTHWKVASLAFTRHFGDYDLFQVTVNEQLQQFVIRYAINGQVFYDNQAGTNYRLGPPQSVVGGNVGLHQATARQGTQAGGGFVVATSWLEGEILVNNSAFEKTVGVLLSTDGGTNWVSTNAGFASQTTSSGLFLGPGVEVWKFKTPELNHNATSAVFQFAVFYRDGNTGELFWDNNFGQNYLVSKVDGSQVE